MKSQDSLLDMWPNMETSLFVILSTLYFLNYLDNKHKAELFAFWQSMKDETL